MKKTFIMMGVAAVLCLGSCAKKENPAEQVAADQTAKAEEVLTGNTAAGGVVDLTDDTLYRPDTKPEVLTILDFNATWCGPCKQLKPVFDQAAGAFTAAKFVSVDVDHNPKTAEAFGIEAVPTVIFLKPDGTMEKYIGTDDLMPYEKLAALVEKSL